MICYSRADKIIGIKRDEEKKKGEKYLIRLQHNTTREEGEPLHFTLSCCRLDTLFVFLVGSIPAAVLHRERVFTRKSFKSENENSFFASTICSDALRE